MEWLLIVLAGGGGAVVMGRRLIERRASRTESSRELESIRQLADEDVTLLGEELHRLDAEVSDHRLDEAGRLDYQRALDAYEAAQRAVPKMTDPSEVSKITDILSAGRYALACVQARVAGLPIPELRVPCFFNPQHGPSVTDVRWTQPGRGTRTIPACAQDAARVTSGEAPEVRKVKIGSRLVPYWQAGSAYLPYGQGYFVSSTIVPLATLDWAFTAPVGDSGFAGDHTGEFTGSGYGGGYSGGGGDGGGSGGGGDGGGDGGGGR